MTKTAPTRTVAAAAVTVAADILSPGRVPRPAQQLRELEGHLFFFNFFGPQQPAREQKKR